MATIATRPTTTPAAMPAVFAVFEPGSGVADDEVDVFSGAVTRIVLVCACTLSERVEGVGAELVTSGVGDGEEEDEAVVVLVELESDL